MDMGASLHSKPESRNSSGSNAVIHLAAKYV